MKNGLLYEDGELIYYVDGEAAHAGLICIDGDYYYISSRGRAIQGQHVVHEIMTNGLLPKGIYTFGLDYKMVEGSYIPPIEEEEDAPKAKAKAEAKAKSNRGKWGAAVFFLLIAVVVLGYLILEKAGGLPVDLLEKLI